jgi:pimeloyl-ACP methyl ester carboxylesterase
MPRFTAYDGTRLAYHERGDGEPLLCLPGGAGRASAYLGGLAEHRRLVLLDNRGTGESDPPASSRVIPGANPCHSASTHLTCHPNPPRSC